MNLRTQISDRLWEAIASAYEAGNFAHAIAEAMHVVTSVLREKSGEDGDGNPLVGKALGGDNPKIRLNSLQTDTEKNIQKGFESILRGMYSAIRNPRSHESGVSDKREHADVIICFIDYLLTVLDASREVFSTEAFMDKVRDRDFVNSERYAHLLVAEIPTGRLGDTLIALYKERGDIPLERRGSLFSTLFRAANESQIGSLMAVVADELRLTNDAQAIKTTFQYMPPEHWPKLSEAVRLRIENKLLTEIRRGTASAERTTKEWLPLSGRAFFKEFALRADFVTALYLKLASGDADIRRYGLFFFKELSAIAIEDKDVQRIIRTVSKAVKNDDREMRSYLTTNIDALPDTWQRAFGEALADLTDKDHPATYLSDGTPFLKRDEEAEFDDDIPF
jgi:uncharacterized protein (TIGR02391 family)